MLTLQTSHVSMHACMHERDHVCDHAHDPRPPPLEAPPRLPTSCDPAQPLGVVLQGRRGPRRYPGRPRPCSTLQHDLHAPRPVGSGDLLTRPPRAILAPPAHTARNTRRVSLPDHVRTAVVLRGSHHDLCAAERDLTRAVLYIPRKTERVRSSGRSRSMTTRVVFQWPGYAFLASEYSHLIPEIHRRYGLRHLRDGVQTVVPLSVLEPSRMLEITSSIEARASRRRSLPPLPSPGDLVSVSAGRWGEFRGVVVSATRTMVVVDVPGSPVCVRADPARVTIVDTKKPLVSG